MDSGKAHELFGKYAASMAYLAVECADGTQRIGSAFHVGEGVFVTARHIVDGNTVTKVATTNGAYIPLTGEEAERARVFLAPDNRPVHRVAGEELRIARGPFFHPDPYVDVAVFQAARVDPKLPVVKLGDHLDDWIGQHDFVL
jgi:hypothetical protein